VTTGSPPPNTGRPVRSKKGEQTRSKIKAAARRALGRKLPADLQLVDVCRAAGVTVGAFYWHFANKEAVVEEVAIDVIGETFDKLRQIGGQDLYEAFYTVNAVFIGARDLKLLARTTYVLIRTSLPVYEVWWRARRGLIEQLTILAAAARASAGLEPVDMAATIELLLTGTEGVYENSFFSAVPGLEMDRVNRDATIAKLASTWRRAALGAEAPGSFVTV
jgi:AcrR family transcriptional regulator